MAKDLYVAHKDTKLPAVQWDGSNTVAVLAKLNKGDRKFQLEQELEHRDIAQNVRVVPKHIRATDSVGGRLFEGDYAVQEQGRWKFYPEDIFNSLFEEVSK